jgi:hypothetical protein
VSLPIIIAIGVAVFAVIIALSRSGGPRITTIETRREDKREDGE